VRLELITDPLSSRSTTTDAQGASHHMSCAFLADDESKQNEIKNCLAFSTKEEVRNQFPGSRTAKKITIVATQ
jgi:hypothetical protein